MSIKTDFERQNLYTPELEMYSMETKSLLLQLLGDRPAFKILDFLIENKGLDFSKKEICHSAGISKATLFNYWPILEMQQIVKITRKFGKTKLYTINNENSVAMKLLELESALIRQSMTKAAKRFKQHKELTLPVNIE